MKNHSPLTYYVCDLKFTPLTMTFSWLKRPIFTRFCCWGSLATFLMLPSPILASAGVCRRREGRKTWRRLNFLPFKTAKTRKCPPILVLQGSLSMFLRSANPNQASVGAYKRRGGHKTRAKDTRPWILTWILNFDTFFLLVLIEDDA